MNVPRFLLMMSFAGAICGFGLPRPAQAFDSQILQFPPGTRFITTSGTGTVRTKPDRAIVVLGVTDWSKDLRLAYAGTEASVRRVRAVGSKFHVEDKDTQTSEISVHPTYAQSSSDEPAGRPKGYRVDKRITLVVKDLDSVPALLSDAVNAGANTIDSVYFDISSARKMKDDARLLALDAAREKAVAMAAELHAKIGRAIIIKESGSDIADLGDRRQTNLFQVEPTMTGNFLPPEGQDIATGQKQVNSSVSVTFELVD